MLLTPAPAESEAPLWFEGYVNTEARYQEIAESIVTAAERAPETIMSGSRPRTRDMALMTAAAFLESGFRPDVSDGTLRGKAGECTVFQLMPNRAGDCDHVLGDLLLYTQRARPNALATTRAASSRRPYQGPYRSLRPTRAATAFTTGESKARVRMMAGRRHKERPPPANDAPPQSALVCGLTGLTPFTWDGNRRAARRADRSHRDRPAAAGCACTAWPRYSC